MEGQGCRGFKCNGNNKQAGVGQRPSAMMEDCIGRQVLQQEALIEKKESGTITDILH